MLIEALILSTLAQAPPEMRLMRNPTIYGDTVVFNYAGDLWTADRKGGVARRLTTHPANESFPRFSPDGKWIAFSGSYDGFTDVYVMSAEGGDPKRLTFEPAPDIVGGWTADGKVAYVTDATTPGTFTLGLKLVSPQGGMPVETKLGEVFDFSFSPDGTKVAFNRNNSHNFNWRRYRGGTQGRIGFSDLKASFYEEIPGGRENSWHPMWVGDWVYYVSDRSLGTRNLYRYHTTSKKVEQLTRFDDADIKWPSTDGKRIVFERDGHLYTYDLGSTEIERLHPQVKTDAVPARPQLRELGGMISNLSVSPSGVRVAVEARGELFSVPAKNGDTRMFSAGSASKEFGVAWAPDGQSIAFLSDKGGEVRLYTMPQMGGDWKEIKIDPSHRLSGFRWSPDGKSISYDTVDNSLYVLNLDTGKAERVFTATYNAANTYDWSPDNKWIAYIDAGRNLFGALHLYDLTAKKSYRITEGYYRDDSVAFDLNGKYLYVVSARTINPTFGDFDFTMQTERAQRVYLLTLAKDTPNPLIPPVDEEPEKKETPPAPATPAAAPQTPPAGPPAGPPAPKPVDVKVDIEGLAARAIALPWPAGNYGPVVGADNGVFTFTQGKLVKFDLGARQSMDILGGVQMVDFTPKRNKMAYKAGPVVGVTDVRPGLEVGVGRVNTNDVEAVVSPRDEWKQIFWEAWRWQRDKFYDKDMLGLDWPRIGKQYEAYLPYLSHRNDLNYVLGLMLSELGTGHAYVGGGDMGVGSPGVPTGALGADFELAGGKVRIKKVYRGLSFEEGRRGPLGEPGVEVKEGEYLLAIDGEELNGRSPSELLVGKVNRAVTLTVNGAPSMTGSHKVRVRTISDESQLRYIEWVEDNRRKVAQMSNGRIGYMHVPNTSIEGVIEFIKGFYSQSDKDALIVDERFNGGGMIPTFFIEKLQRTYTTALRQRNGGDVAFPPQSIEGPKAMLINEYAGSGGDLFPWFFRQARLGPLIGTRTWGGLVGIAGSAPLVDGGFLTAPEFGLYDLDKGEWIAENKGVEPDIHVDARPDLIAQGRDPQLEKAVEVLKDALKKGPRPTKRPEFPRVKVAGQGGQ